MDWGFNHSNAVIVLLYKPCFCWLIKVNDHTHIGVTSLQRFRNPRQQEHILQITIAPLTWKCWYQLVSDEKKEEHSWNYFQLDVTKNNKNHWAPSLLVFAALAKSQWMQKVMDTHLCIPAFNTWRIVRLCKHWDAYLYCSEISMCQLKVCGLTLLSACTWSPFPQQSERSLGFFQTLNFRVATNQSDLF